MSSPGFRNANLEATRDGRLARPPVAAAEPAARPYLSFGQPLRTGALLVRLVAPDVLSQPGAARIDLREGRKLGQNRNAVLATHLHVARVCHRPLFLLKYHFFVARSGNE